jgi:hypothetical protein
MELFGFAATAVVVWIVGSLARAMMTGDHRSDPVYKKNLERLIERNREFEEARKRNGSRS